MNLWTRLFGRRPIVTRLVVAVAAAMALVLLLAAAFVYWRVSYALGRQLDQDLAAYQETVVAAVRQGAEPPRDTRGQSFQVYDADGTLVRGDRDVVRLLDRAEVAAARRGSTTTVEVGSFLPVPDAAYRVLVQRVSTPAGARVVAAALSRRKHDEALRELMLQLAIADLLALVAAAFVGHRTARAALDPVEDYRRAVERVGDELDRRLPVAVGRDDELTRLGHTFNDLLARIEAGAERERQFLADASHELRSPLALMRTEVEWARHRPRTPEETATVLDSLRRQVDRLVDVSNALLDLEELRAEGPLPREPVRLDDLVAEAVRSVAPSRADVRVDAPHDLVEVNRRWTELALANLVGNALRHGAAPVVVEARVREGAVVVTVADAGPGLPPSFAPQAFDRFSRAEESRSTPGSGLGLALVRAVGRAHGGDARLLDAPAGTRVELRLVFSGEM